MVKYFGKIGFAETIETSPGVWQKDVIIEREAFGDVLRNSRAFEADQKVNDDLTVGNSISIVADAYMTEHFFAMRYVTWQGAKWIVENVNVEPPRLVLRLGGPYNGKSPAAP